jgi:hypothetical protein
MLLVRRILFVIFAVAYLIVCPLLILYSFGYVYDPLGEEVARTGIVSLSTVPEGADIFLEGSRFVHQTPASVGKLLAGDYHITLKKKGYQPWTHWFTVEPGKAVKFDNILLVPYQWPVKSVSGQSYRQLIPLGEGRRLFLASAGSKLGSFFIYDRDGTASRLVPSSSTFSTLGVNRIYHTGAGDSLLVSGGVFWDRKTLYLNLDAAEPNVTDVTDIIEGEPLFVMRNGGEQIYMLHGNCASRADIKTKRLHSCELENIRGLGLYGKWLYVVDANGTLFRESVEPNKVEVLAQGSGLSKRLFGRSDFYRITVEDNGIIFFLGSDGDFVASVPPYNIASVGIRNFSLSRNGNLLLYWSKDSIKVVDFSVQPNRSVFDERFRIKPVYEKGRDIRQCFWAYDDSHILFSDAHSVYVVEIEPQGASHVDQICNILRDSDVFYDRSKGCLYYLEEDKGALERLQIFPD